MSNTTAAPHPNPLSANAQPTSWSTPDRARIFSWGDTRGEALRQFRLNTNGLTAAGLVPHPQGGYIAFGRR
jgi:hypothetical protein